MDRRIKFRHLEVFSAVARSRSMKRAAEQLNLTQPAVTKTLKELEEIAGHLLAERSRAGVRLTSEGETFLQFAEQSTAAIKHGLHSLQRSGATGGRLLVGALPSVASSVLPGAALTFSRKHPDTLLEIFEGPHLDLTARLRRGGLDLVVGRLGGPESMVGLAFRQLYSEEVVIASRPDSPAARVRILEELEAFRVVYPPKDSAIRSLVARLLITHGVPLFSKRIESASSALGRTLTMTDPNIVWIISKGVVANDVVSGQLVLLDIDTSPTSGAVGVMTRADEIMPTAVRSFLRYL